MSCFKFAFCFLKKEKSNRFFTFLLKVKYAQSHTILLFSSTSHYHLFPSNRRKKGSPNNIFSIFSKNEINSLQLDMPCFYTNILTSTLNKELHVRESLYIRELILSDEQHSSDLMMEKNKNNNLFIQHLMVSG